MNADAEQDALLEAIFASPADDTPRLVYADWLQEHGEATTAEFIRVQIELERHPERSAKRAPLRKAEAPVWGRYSRQLARRFPGMKFYKGDFHRGFHDGATGGKAHCPMSDFLTHSGRWWPWLPIRWMWFNTWDQFPDELLESDHLPRLTRLSFYQTDSRTVIREAFLVRLFSSPRLERLIGLDVWGAPLSAPVVDAILESPFLGQLRRLHVEYGASGRTGWLAYPEDLSPHDQHRLGEPGGAPAAIRRQLGELRDHLLEVPPGTTAWESLLDASTHQPTAVYRRV